MFGDTHGHLRLMFQLCRLWQLNNGVHLDGILQAGDLGFFPDISKLDKATKRFARSDPEELGFAEYFAIPQPASSDELLERTLNGDPDSLDTIRCNVVFCHGNHEDFQELDSITHGSAFSPVDKFNRLWFLRSGETTEVAGVTVAALGGAPEAESVDKNDESVLGPNVSYRAVQRLRKNTCDILLAHGAPIGLGGDSDRFGSRLLRQVIETVQPSFNFYAHHTKPIPAGDIGRTRCVWLGDTRLV
ncbi:MAG: metallophosphoesterase family protein [Pirellulaceae bacterium]